MYHTNIRLYLHMIFLNDSFSSTLVYTPQPHAGAMAMQLAVLCIAYATSSKEKTGDIITFTQFEEGNLLSVTCNDTKSRNKYDDDSTIAPLITKEKMDVMSSDYDYDAEAISTDMLEDIRDGSQSHTSINSRYVCYNIHDSFKKS